MQRLDLRALVLLVLPLLLVACHSQGADDTEPREADHIIDILQLRPGMTVADLGAGDGDWSEDLLPAIGEDGTLWATEVDEDLVEDLRQRFEDHNNVRVVLGDDQATGLPPDCCDAIFVRLVYHHFTDPAPMRADLRQALQRATEKEYARRLPHLQAIKETAASYTGLEQRAVEALRDALSAMR